MADANNLESLKQNPSLVKSFYEDESNKSTHHDVWMDVAKYYISSKPMYYVAFIMLHEPSVIQEFPQIVTKIPSDYFYANKSKQHKFKDILSAFVDASLSIGNPTPLKNMVIAAPFLHEEYKDILVKWYDLFLQKNSDPYYVISLGDWHLIYPEVFKNHFPEHSLADLKPEEIFSHKIHLIYPKLIKALLSAQIEHDSQNKNSPVRPINAKLKAKELYDSDYKTFVHVGYFDDLMALKNVVGEICVSVYDKTNKLFTFTDGALAAIFYGRASHYFGKDVFSKINDLGLREIEYVHDDIEDETDDDHDEAWFNPAAPGNKLVGIAIFGGTNMQPKDYDKLKQQALTLAQSLGVVYLEMGGSAFDMNSIRNKSVFDDNTQSDIPISKRKKKAEVVGSREEAESLIKNKKYSEFIQKNYHVEYEDLASNIKLTQLIKQDKKSAAEFLERPIGFGVLVRNISQNPSGTMNELIDNGLVEFYEKACFYIAKNDISSFTESVLPVYPEILEKFPKIIYYLGENIFEASVELGLDDRFFTNYIKASLTLNDPQPVAAALAYANGIVPEHPLMTQWYKLFLNKQNGNFLKSLSALGNTGLHIRHSSLFTSYFPPEKLPKELSADLIEKYNLYIIYPFLMEKYLLDKDATTTGKSLQLLMNELKYQYVDQEDGGGELLRSIINLATKGTIDEMALTLRFVNERFPWMISFLIDELSDLFEEMVEKISGNIKGFVLILNRYSGTSPLADYIKLFPHVVKQNFDEDSVIKNISFNDPLYNSFAMIYPGLKKILIREQVGYDNSKKPGRDPVAQARARELYDNNYRTFMHTGTYDELKSVKNIVGEICVSVYDKTNKLFSHSSNALAAIFYGRASHYFDKDVYSHVNQYGMRELGTAKGLEQDHDEAWFNPAAPDNKLLGFAVVGDGTEESYGKLRQQAMALAEANGVIYIELRGDIWNMSTIRDKDVSHDSEPEDGFELDQEKRAPPISRRKK